jgi:predicted DNA-binding transcriptional regulator AlpA
VRQYLNIKELTKKLRICPASVYNHMKTIPEFPQPIKIGRSSRWDAEEVDNFMNKAPRGAYGEVR